MCRETTFLILPPVDPRYAIFLFAGHRIVRRNRTNLRAKNYCPKTPVLRFFNHFKERLTLIKVVFFFSIEQHFQLKRKKHIC